MSRMRKAGDPPCDKKLGALTGIGVTDAPEAERLIAAIWSQLQLLVAQLEQEQQEQQEPTLEQAAAQMLYTGVLMLLSARIEALKAETAEVTRLVLERVKAEG